VLDSYIANGFMVLLKVFLISNSLIELNEEEEKPDSNLSNLP